MRILFKKSLLKIASIFVISKNVLRFQARQALSFGYPSSLCLLVSNILRVTFSALILIVLIFIFYTKLVLHS